MALFGSLAFILAGFSLDQIWISFIPITLILGALAFIYTFQTVLVFFILLPFSVELYLPNDLGIDLPSELILFALFGITLLLFAGNKRLFIRKHDPVILLTIFLHLSWILYSGLLAENQLVSFKFFIAKLWYVFPFFFLIPNYLQDRRNVTQWAQFFLFGLTLSVLYVLLRHASFGFSFDTIGKAVSPIYRNHVNYAALLTLSIPISIFVMQNAKKKGLYATLVLFLIVATYFSYSRAAYISLLVMLISALLLRYRLLFLSTILSIFFGLSIVIWANQNNRYVYMAPNYESTIAHGKFDNLIEATYRGEDISTMERLHRWIAGFKMVQQKPITGFGPNNFYFSYKPYTVNSFKTYVSHNPDRSGIHNYFLMTAAEQGLVGLGVFMTLLLTVLFKAEQLYHSTKDLFVKKWIFSVTLVLVAIVCLNLINDLIEAVKIGSFFFLVCGIISTYSMRAK
jgi:O-antigen ligase